MNCFRWEVRCIGALIAVTASTGEVSAQPFRNHGDSVPPGWTGRKFVLSRDYPTALPAAETLPWKGIDFRTQPKQYLESVLAYVLEGNREADWVVQNNTVRKWYHAPGLAKGTNRREFINGLTRERRSDPGDLHVNQSSSVGNWAVGFYNPIGGYVIGQVWADPDEPDATKASFPDGTVTAKLLFTEASITQVPFLEGAIAWQANIGHNLHNTPGPVPEVRLLQLDIAVRDSAADAYTGWLFGTFVYQFNATESDQWKRLVPVGLMWGNDPDLTPDRLAAGEKLQEGWINPSLTLAHLGWHGRLNGPVDNPISSCLSCHGMAEWPGGRMTFRDSDSLEKKMSYFKNVRAGQPFTPGSLSLDYSLQLRQGFRNYPPSPANEAPANDGGG